MSPKPVKILKPRRRSRGGIKYTLLLLLIALLAWWLAVMLGPKRPEPGSGKDEMPTTKLGLKDDGPPVRKVSVRPPRPRAAESAGASSMTEFIAAEPAPVATEIVTGPCILPGRLTFQGQPHAWGFVVARATWDDSAFPGFAKDCDAPLDSTRVDSEGRFVIRAPARPGGWTLAVYGQNYSEQTLGFVETTTPWMRMPERTLELQNEKKTFANIDVSWAGTDRPVEVKVWVRSSVPPCPLGKSPMRRPEALERSQSAGLDRVQRTGRGIVMFPGKVSWAEEYMPPPGPWEVMVAAAGFEPKTLRVEDGAELSCRLMPLRKGELVAWPDAIRGGLIIGADAAVPQLIEPDDQGRIACPPDGETWTLIRAGFPPVDGSRAEDLVNFLATPPAFLTLPDDEGPQNPSNLVLESLIPLDTDPDLAEKRLFIDQAFGRSMLRPRGQVIAVAPGRYKTRWRSHLGQELRGGIVEVEAGASATIRFPKTEGAVRTLKITASDEESQEIIPQLSLLLGHVVGDDFEANIIARSDAAGSVIVSGVPASAFDWTLAAPGYEPKIGSSQSRSSDDVGEEQVSVKMRRAKGAIEVLVHDRNDKPMAGLEATLVDRQRNQRRSVSDSAGIMKFEGLATGRYVLFTGRDKTPGGDSIQWLFSGAAGPVLEVKAGTLTSHTWRLPRRISCRFELSFKDAPAGPIHLQFERIESAAGEGLWPQIDVESAEAGFLEVEGLFPGTYHVLATVGTEAALLRIDVPRRPTVSVPLPFDFKPRRER